MVFTVRNRRITTLLFSLLSVAGFLEGSYATGLCEFDSLNWHDFADLKACFDAIAFNQSSAEQTLRVIEYSLFNYAFLPIFKESGAPWYYQIDIMSELSAMKTRDYGSDYEFHADVSRLITSLNDAHTLYQLPSCYGSFLAVNPVILGVEYDTPDSSVRYDGLFGSHGVRVVLKPMSLFGVTVTPPSIPTGAEVVAIDGEPAIEALLEWGTHSSVASNDPSARFNAATIRNRFVVRSLSYDQMPFRSSVQYTIRIPDPDNPSQVGSLATFELPWQFLLTTSEGINGIEDFQLKCGRTKAPQTSVCPSSNQTTNDHTQQSFSSQQSLLRRGERAVHANYISPERILSNLNPSKHVLHTLRERTEVFTNQQRPLELEHTIPTSSMAPHEIIPRHLQSTPSNSFTSRYQSNENTYANIEKIYDSESADGLTLDILTLKSDFAPVAAKERIYVLLRVVSFDPQSLNDCFSQGNSKQTIDPTCASPTDIQPIEQCFTEMIYAWTNKTTTKVFDAMERASEQVSGGSWTERFKKVRLLIDMSSNPGGFVVLGLRTLLNLFDKLYNNPLDTIPSFDTWPSTLFSRLMYFSMSQGIEIKGFPANSYRLDTMDGTSTYPVINETSGAFSSEIGLEWFLRGRKTYRAHVFGEHDGFSNGFSQIGNYSTLSHNYSFPFRLIDPLEERAIQKPRYTLDASNTLIITDGLCGSTCGQFVQIAHAQGLARIIGIGGLPTKSLISASFTGGSIFSNVEVLSAIVDDAIRAGFTWIPAQDDIQGIGYFPTSAAFSFNLPAILATPETPIARELNYSTKVAMLAPRQLQFAPRYVDARLLVWSSVAGDTNVALLAAAAEPFVQLQGSAGANAALTPEQLGMLASSTDSSFQISGAASYVLVIALGICALVAAVFMILWFRAPSSTPVRSNQPQREDIEIEMPDNINHPTAPPLTRSMT